jgi:hypothetical protein
MDYGLLYKYGLWTCKLSMINCKKYGGIVNYLWSNVNSEQSGEEESSDSGIIGDYETPSMYEPSEPRPRRRPEDDDVIRNQAIMRFACTFTQINVCLFN